jgi:hypothetical protein
MARRCGTSKPCGMSQGLFNPFFQNGAPWMGGGSTPPGPSEIFGANLKLFINTSRATNKTLSGDFSTRVDSLTSDDANAYSFAFAPAELSKVKFNGKCFFVGKGGDNTLINASKSNFKLLNDGSAFYVAARLNIMTLTSDTSVNSYGTIVSTITGAASVVGFEIAYENRSSLSRTNALIVKIRRGTVDLVNVTVDSAFTQNQFFNLEVSYSGTVLTVYVNGVSIGTSNNNGTATNANSTADFTLFNREATATYGKNLLMKHFVIVNRVATSNERILTRTFLEYGSEVFGTGIVANVYSIRGQSNAAGLGSLIGELAAELQGVQASWMYGKTTSSINLREQLEYLEFPENNNDMNLNSFGPEMRFAYEMNALAPGQIVICKHATNGAPLLNTNSSSWNVARVNGSLDQAQAQLLNTIYLLKYEHDRSSVYRGMLWRQGEQEADTDSSTYKADFTNLIIDELDFCQTNSIDTTKLRICVSLVDNPPRTFAVKISGNQIDVVDNFFPDNPSQVGRLAGLGRFSTIGLPLSDGTHLTGPGQNTQALSFVSYYAPYINE